MNSYAQIIDGVVTQQTVAAQMPVDGTTWIDVTTLSPQPTLGWTYNGISFATPPVYLYAQVIDGIVTQVMSAFAIPVDGTKWLDITTLSPSPAVDWSYDGTSFSPPPIYLYARVIGGIVTRIMTAFTMPADGTLWVDITNVTPAPAIDWRYDGASFTLPPVNVYAQISNGVVSQVISATTMPVDATTWVDATAVTPVPGVNWTYNGTVFAPPQPHVFAQIVSNAVSQTLTAFVAPADSTVWIDITGVTPVPLVGWSYNGGRFAPPPEFNYARIVSTVVTQIVTAFKIPAGDATWIDITATTPFPAVNWTYDGTSFAAPAVFVAPPPPSDDLVTINAATIALGLSDSVIIRCFESGVNVPQDWLDYRHALRTLIASGTGTLPSAPALPGNLI